MNWVDALEVVVGTALVFGAVVFWIWRRFKRQADQDLWYARKIAVALNEKHYSDNEVKFKPYDDLYGLLMQIDNMTCGMERKKNEPPYLSRDPAKN